MLDQLSANDFSPFIGKVCRLSAQGLHFDLVIEAVEERIRSKPPQATRIPFNVLLSGPQQPGFLYGTFAAEILETGFSMTGLYIERTIMPQGMEPTKAYYQLIFN